ncbi:MAG: class IV adenylate cyclase, partial [Pseudomonadota bacterium]
MPRNVEIKAHVRDVAEVRRRAEDASGGPPEVLEQEDVFFPAERGRLKLRRLAPDFGQLIFYERPDVSGPKTCIYAISDTQDPQQLREVLSQALGEAMIVRKVREVYMVGQTRIHVDQVEGLGAFLELE